MNVIVTTAVATEVVTVAQVKSNIRVEHSVDDTLIGRRLKMARELAEKITRRSIGAQTLQLRTNTWGGSIELLRPPLTAVSAVTYLDIADSEQTLSASYYYVDQSGVTPTIRWVPGVSLPSLSLRADAVRVAYTAGYTSATCPEIIMGWIEMMAGVLYDHRELSAEKVVSDHPAYLHMLTPVSEIGY